MQKIVSSDNTAFYVIIQLVGFSGSGPLSTAERNYLLNHNFILYDTTRDDNASITLRAPKSGEYDKYKFLMDENEIIDTVFAEYATTEELNNAVSSNGLLKELLDLTNEKVSMTLRYNYYYEEI